MVKMHVQMHLHIYYTENSKIRKVPDVTNEVITVEEASSSGNSESTVSLVTRLRGNSMTEEEFMARQRYLETSRYRLKSLLFQ